MATTQTYQSLTAEQKTFYDRSLLERLLPNLTFAKYGQKRPIPKREGDTINFRKFNSLAAATTALTEGETPAGNSLNISTITATVQQYGDFIVMSDKLDMVGIDPVIAEATAVLGEQAALTIDTVARDVVSAGSNVIYANNKDSTANVAATDILTAVDIKKAVRALRNKNAKPMSDGYFIGIIDPSQSFDIQNDPEWQDLSKYNGGTAIMKGEIGKIAGVRFIETTNTKVKTGEGSASADVHCAIIFGQDAYGVTDVEGKSKPQVIVKEAGSSGTADPLNQRSSVGWKTMFTTVRLEEFAMVRLETGVTA